MARLIYAMNISVDGYISDREGRFDWSVPTAELYETIIGLQGPAGTYLYGRRLYEMMAVWQTIHVDEGGSAMTPGLLEHERAYAAMWRGADKIVFSTTLAEPSTPRTRIERAF